MAKIIISITNAKKYGCDDFWTIYTSNLLSYVVGIGTQFGSTTPYSVNYNILGRD